MPIRKLAERMLRVPMKSDYQHETEPEDDIAPTRTNCSDRAVTLVLYDAARTAAEERPDGSKEEEQYEKKGVEEGRC